MNPSTEEKNVASAEECPICCEKFNKSNHACIECEYITCKYKVCVTCVRSYLLTSTNEPHCMECKQAWTPRFMLLLTKKWMKETYRPHREKLLCDVELSKLADTMEAAERYKAANREEGIRQQLRGRERDLRAQLLAVQTDITRSFMRENNLRHTRPSAAAGGNVEKAVFFMSCPSPTCNGMLSTQYKCGICELFTCHTCHEILGLTKTAPHTCDPNNIASAEAIKKETKQCPGCHNRIYRTEGCSQMWCTGCHTAFDWNTGRKVVNEQLHNPHWLEYQRSQKNGQVRAPGDVPCGGICSRQDLNHLIARLPLPSSAPDIPIITARLRQIHRFVTEVTLNQIRTIRENCQQLRDFQDQRVKYIVGEMTKEKMAAHIFKSDQNRQRDTEILHIYELLGAVGIDTFNRFLVEMPRAQLFALVNEQLAEYNELRLHCNTLFAAISNTYNKTVPQVDELWLIQTKRFTSKSMLRVVGSSGAAATVEASAATELL